MLIREAKIFSFGKLQRRDFYFEPGINVVYGANESGKTTLHEFLLAMLFGLEKSRGRAKGTEGYLRYEPWHAPAYYSGAMRFEVDGRPFYLERNFYHREKREMLRNEADGEELSVAYGDLAVLLGGIGKETFGNTYDISQSGAATGQELFGVLTEYLSDASEGGSSDIHVTRALELLETKRKELNADLKKEQEQRKREEHALMTEQKLLEQDCIRLEHTLLSERQMSENAAESKKNQDERREGTASKDAYDVPENGLRRRVMRNIAGIGAGVLSAAVLGNWLCYRKMAYPAMLFGITELLLGVAVIALGIFAVSIKREFRHSAGETQQSETTIRDEAGEQMEAARRQNKRLLEQMEETLSEKETRFYNVRERLKVIEQPGEHERELQTELDAVLLAKEEIGNLARELGDERRDGLNSEVSRYVSAMTGGRYDSVSVDENGGLRVLTDGKEVSPEALSRGTLEQFYLAFRLAVGDIVTKEESMPLFLDEAFTMYDDRRLMQTLRVLEDLDRQVILFTCQSRELDLLEKMGIPYHRVLMEP